MASSPTVPENLRQIFTKIDSALKRSDRPPEAVRLIGVGKKQSLDRLIEAADAGLGDFGENYVQEWKAKQTELNSLRPDLAQTVRWHLIGHLQSNKVEAVVGQVALIHTLDSLRLAEKISRRALSLGLAQPVLFEIKLSAEAGKHGMASSALLKDLKAFRQIPGLEYRGLMAVPPFFERPEQVRPYFRKLKSLLDECNTSGLTSPPMRELSMGMSHDFEVAIEEGATLVRIGTALFGSR